MPKISSEFSGQTVITTFEMTPGTAQDLMDELRDAYDKFISHQPGFIGAGLHMNDAQTRIANYSQWQRREDFQAMLRTAAWETLSPPMARPVTSRLSTPLGSIDR